MPGEMIRIRRPTIIHHLSLDLGIHEPFDALVRLKWCTTGKGERGWGSYDQLLGAGGKSDVQCLTLGKCWARELAGGRLSRGEEGFINTTTTRLARRSIDGGQSYTIAQCYGTVVRSILINDENGSY